MISTTIALGYWMIFVPTDIHFERLDSYGDYKRDTRSGEIRSAYDGAVRHDLLVARRDDVLTLALAVVVIYLANWVRCKTLNITTYAHPKIVLACIAIATTTLITLLTLAI